MRVIEFKYQDQEVLRYRPSKRFNLIGRASNCEIVLRRKNIQPVHFILEWVGEGEFDESTGQWVIVDVTGKDKTERDIGVGIVLKEHELKLGDYSVRVLNDQLAESDVHRGVLSRNINDLSTQNDVMAANLPSRRDYTAEVITFSKDLEKIIHVAHFPQIRTVGRISPFQDLKNVQFIWNKAHKDIAFIENSGESVDFKIKHVKANSAIHLSQGNKFEMTKKDFVFLETSKYRYFVRLVPELKAVQDSVSWLRDKTTVLLLLFALLLGAGFFMLPTYVPVKTEPEVPPRVARIELPPDPPKEEPAPPPPPEPVQEAKPVVQEPPKPQEPVEVQVEQKPIPKPEPKVKQEQVTPPKVAEQKPTGAAPATVVNVKNQKDIRAGLNSPAPIKDVNTVGILGKLKTSQTTMAKIDPKDISDTSANEIAATNRGVVVKQPKMGTIEGGSKNSSDLAGASTTLHNAKENAQNLAGSKMGLTNAKSSSGLGLANSGSDGGLAGKRNTLGDDSSDSDMDVVGGLDKESVRRAIRENRKALANCFETGLLKKKNLGGRLSLKWKIKPEGPVESIAVQSSNTGLESFDQCVTRVVKGIVFAKAPNKQPTIVTFPFQFKERK